MATDRRIKVWVQEFPDRATLQLQWHDPVTRRRRTKSAGTADPKEAEKKRADLEYELEHGLHKDGARMSWEAFRELLEREYLPGRKPNTLRQYAQSLDLLEQVCHPATLAAVDGRLLSRFVAELRVRPCAGRPGYSPKTISVYLSLIGAALAWAAAPGQKFLAEAPPIPAVKVPRRDPRGVPEDAFSKLYGAAQDVQTRAYLLCAWRAGLRLSEALDLEREETRSAPWLDLARDRIVFPAEYVKAGHDQTVPLDAELKAALGDLPQSGPKVFRFIGRSGQTLSPKTISARIISLAKRAGVRLSYHALRRGFVSHFAARVPAPVLTLLSRNTLAVAMKHYVDVDDAAARAVAERNGGRNSVENH